MSKSANFPKEVRERAVRLVPERQGSHASQWSATLVWADWFNRRRLLGPVGYLPPAEARYCAAIRESAATA